MSRKSQIIPHIVQLRLQEVIPTPPTPIRRISINSNRKTALKWPNSCGFWCELAQQRALEVKKIRLQKAADNGFQMYPKHPVICRIQGRGYGIRNANLVPPASNMSDIVPAVKVTRHMKYVPKPPPILEMMEIIGRRMLPKKTTRPVWSPGTYYIDKDVQSRKKIQMFKKGRR